MGNRDKNGYSKSKNASSDFPNAIRTKNEELFALEEDCEMPKLLNKLNDNGVIYQLNEKFISHLKIEPTLEIGSKIRGAIDMLIK